MNYFLIKITMKIKVLVMDIDGTLTDGKIHISDEGEVFKSFNVKDGYGIANLYKIDILPVIITGRKSKIVEYRAKELNIKEIYQGVHNKVDKLKYICEKYKISLKEVAYIGDDINDLECMKICGISACPNDAAEEVLDSVDYICKKNGGEGAVREFINFISNNGEMKINA